MGPLPKGSRNVHINKSQGPDTNIMKFYVTQNSTTYGRQWEKFKPRQGRHTGTGYKSNFRPGVYYNQRLDEVDNPVMSRICANNYMTVTTRDFQPYQENSGTEPLPFYTHQMDSGFVRDKPVTHPTQKEVKDVFIDTRVASAPANILPRGKPRLHTLKAKDPVELENNGYGPKYMATETQERFKTPKGQMDLNGKVVGPQEGTGFTHSYSVEPVTFQPGSDYRNDRPGYETWRPTGVSIMKTSFLPLQFPGGREPLPNLAFGSDHDSGFTREKAKPLYVHRVMGDAYDKAGDMPGLKLDRTRKKDPTEFLNMTQPNNYSSVSMNVFKGQQNPDLSEAGRLGRTATGQLEPSGYSNNSDRFVQTSLDDPRRFTTHYMTRFTDVTPYGLDREGHCRGGLQQQKPDGFTKSTSVHVHGADLNTTDTLRRLEPYVSRSIKARDVFYDDHLHDSKSHRITSAVY